MTDTPPAVRVVSTGRAAYDFREGVLHAIVWPAFRRNTLVRELVIPRVLVTSHPTGREPTDETAETDDGGWLRIKGRRYTSSALYRTAEPALDGPAFAHAFTVNRPEFRCYRHNHTGRAVPATTRAFAAIDAMEHHVLDHLDIDMPDWRSESRRLLHACEFYAALRETARLHGVLVEAQRRQRHLHATLDQLAHPGAPAPTQAQPDAPLPQRCLAPGCPHPASHLVHARHRITLLGMSFAYCLEHATDPALDVLASQPFPPPDGGLREPAAPAPARSTG